MQLSFLSLITSISNSFQPSKHSSIKTWFAGDSFKPFLTILKKSFLFFAIPPPSPPRVKEGLAIAGKPICFKAFSAYLIFFTIFDLGKVNPISSIFCLNFFLSSAFEIALDFAPISSILYFFKIPFFSASIAKFKAV